MEVEELQPEAGHWKFQLQDFACLCMSMLTFLRTGLWLRLEELGLKTSWGLSIMIDKMHVKHMHNRDLPRP